MGWLPCEIRQKLEMLRLWSMEFKSICEEIDMIPNFENNGFINLEQAKESLCSIRYYSTIQKG